MPETSIYGAGFAPLYDLFQATKDYRAEARYVRGVADELLGTGGRSLQLLDLACGTGSHAIALSAMRCEVTGVDISPEMLALARKKARAANRRIRFEQQDLTRLTLPPGSWDVVTCLFDSLGYLRSDARIRTALRRLRMAMRPGGVAVVEVWHAPAMLGHFDPLRVRRVSGGGLEAVRIAETRLLERNLAEVRYEIFSRKKSRPWHRFHERHVNRFFTASELEQFLRGAGLDVARITGGFDAAANVSDDAWHLVAVAQRSS
jgi:ubiquinone/menaquinone biosynthesis C-methylase UbiE